MAKVRSPNYPLMDLGTALEAVRPALKAENRNKMSRSVLAKHLGYNSLNGRALGKIGAIRAYGLIDGSGDELRVSDDAVTALLNPDRGLVYREALKRLADKPTLFQEIQKQYPADLPSESNLSFWLVQQKRFTQEAAGKAAKTFLATMRLVYEGAGDYNPPVEPEDEEMIEQVQVRHQLKSLLDLPASSIRRPGVMHPGMLQEVFNLEEGTVTLMFPGDMSEDSYQDLEDRLKIVLRGLKRRATGHRVTRDALAGIQEALNEPNPAQMPFMVTNAQKQKLREMGYEDEAISNMTPVQVQEAIAGKPWSAK